MKISERSRGGVTILDVEGKITIGKGDVALRESVQGKLSGGIDKLLINLANVTTIDSSGVGELVSSYTTATNRGAKLKLLNIPPKVEDVLTVTQLITVFETFENEDEAVRSFGG